MNKFWIIGLAVVILLMTVLVCWGFREVKPTDEELIEFYCKTEDYELVEFRGLDELSSQVSLSYIAINSDGHTISGEVNRDWVLNSYKTFH